MLAFFQTLVKMSVSSVWIILAVILFRLILRQIPKQARVLMWILPAVRLTVPFSFESRFSVTPEPAKVIPQISGISAAPLSTTDILIVLIWAIVTAGMLLYMLLSFLRLRLRVREKLLLRDNIFICDKIDSPFVLGLIRPKIYIPSDMDSKELDYVLLHEQAHIKRLDTLWKPLAFLILSLHWFNPLVWAAYILFTRDIELACDERAVKALSLDERKAYSSALLSCCTQKRFAAACPFAFGETPVRQRIKSILSYRKPKLIHKLIAVICCTAATLLFLTNPVTAKVTKESVAVINDPLQNLWYEPPTTEPVTKAPTEVPTKQITEAPAKEYDNSGDDTYYETEEYYQESEESYYEYDNGDDNNGLESVDDHVEITPFPDDYSANIPPWVNDNQTVMQSSEVNLRDPYTDANGNSVFQWDPPAN